MDDSKRNRILASLSRNPNAKNYDIAKNLSGVLSYEVAEVRAAMNGETPPEPQETLAGNLEAIPLNQKRVMPQKPQGSDCRRRIHEIKRGVCYRVADFAMNLGISEETLRKHARTMGCLKWVEVSPDNFEEAIMNPETAKQYLR